MKTLISGGRRLQSSRASVDLKWATILYTIFGCRVVADRLLGSTLQLSLFVSTQIHREGLPQRICVESLQNRFVNKCCSPRLTFTCRLYENDDEEVKRSNGSPFNESQLRKDTAKGRALEDVLHQPLDNKEEVMGKFDIKEGFARRLKEPNGSLSENAEYPITSPLKISQDTKSETNSKPAISLLPGREMQNEWDKYPENGGKSRHPSGYSFLPPMLPLADLPSSEQENNSELSTDDDASLPETIDERRVETSSMSFNSSNTTVIEKGRTMFDRLRFSKTNSDILLPAWKLIGTDNKNDKPSILEGVLPVADLFYRSSQAPTSAKSMKQGTAFPQPFVRTSTNNKYDEEADGVDYAEDDDDQSLYGDDEELPFSAEQSDRLSTNGVNRVRIRRNQAEPADTAQSFDKKKGQRRRARRRRAEYSAVSLKKSTDRNVAGLSTFGRDEKRSSTMKFVRKKMIRRGMEMLVGGEPINADPPLRSVEIKFDRGQHDWAQVITTSSRDFGPLLHTGSAAKVDSVSRGLFSEHFVRSAIKWKICPRDFRSIVQLKYGKKSDNNMHGQTDTPDVHCADSKNQVSEAQNFVTNDLGIRMKYVGRDLQNKTEIETEISEDFDCATKKPNDESSADSECQHLRPTHRESSLLQSHETPSDSRGQHDIIEGGELRFTLSGVSREDLGSGEGGGCRVFRRVLQRGIQRAIKADSLGYEVRHMRVAPNGQLSDYPTVFINVQLSRISRLALVEVDGTVEVAVLFNLMSTQSKRFFTIEREMRQFSHALSDAVDSDAMVLAIASSAKEEQSWPLILRNRVVEEMLFEVEEVAEENGFAEEELGALQPHTAAEDYGNSTKVEGEKKLANEGSLSHSSKTKTATECSTKEKTSEIRSAQRDAEDYASYVGAGSGGVFYDYSKASIDTSPFRGTLGPLLVDAVVARALQHQPRLIAVGDVHGCVDELQALLRRCDFRPGDLVVFLGDLVSKGPDSLGVVQMARELGAIGVRGNHDFEVIRWHQAIMSGADPPVIGSEHYQIASGLSKADLKWMYSLPWYLSSKELNALFVHAGFVSGIRLSKQNPRLMMNMRSILPDGTVTSKFFNNWPWARLWDGPHTVFFGHDADRGLQQYEHAIGLDTGCVYGGRLTACILPEKRLVSVSAKREYFTCRRKHFD